MNVYPGLMVLYRPRPGQIRAGQTDLAAMVTAVYPGDRCDLNIYPPMSEPYQQPKVPMLSEMFSNHVWMLPPGPDEIAIQHAIQQIMAMDNTVLAPLIDRLAQQELRIEAVEAKRGPGRPRKDEAA